MKKNIPICLTAIGLLLVACGGEPAPMEEAAAPRPTATLLSTTAQPTPTQASVSKLVAAAGKYRAADCPFEIDFDATVDCGYLTVPENRSLDEGAKIELAVAILRAAGTPVEPDPIAYLAGGPGSSALVDLISDPQGWLDYPFHQNRDIIFIDQRGTGYSLPTLNCPELEALETEETDSKDPELEATIACRSRLRAEGIDLAAYNTDENAADIASLQTALGYEQINLYGVSYGTRLCLAVLRDHPVGLRSVVLDSPFPPNVDLPTEEALTSMKALRRLFDSCAADPDCNAAYPNLEATLLTTVTELNEMPGETELEDYETGESYPVEIYGDDLLKALIQALYDESSIRLLPRVIYEAANGSFETYALLGGGEGASRLLQDEQDRSDSEGMFNSVTCHDEYAFGDYDVAEQAAIAAIRDELLSGLFTAEGIFATCAVWDVGSAAPRENQAVVSDVPTLILAGEYDPVTPPLWGQLAAETLSRSFFYEIPGFGHSVTAAPGCPVEIMTMFFTNPEDEPDGRCVLEMSGPDWVLPEEELEY